MHYCYASWLEARVTRSSKSGSCARIARQQHPLTAVQNIISVNHMSKSMTPPALWFILLNISRWWVRLNSSLRNYCPVNIALWSSGFFSLLILFVLSSTGLSLQLYRPLLERSCWQTKSSNENDEDFSAKLSSGMRASHVEENIYYQIKHELFIHLEHIESVASVVLADDSQKLVNKCSLVFKGIKKTNTLWRRMGSIHHLIWRARVPSTLALSYFVMYLVVILFVLSIKCAGASVNKSVLSSAPSGWSRSSRFPSWYIMSSWASSPSPPWKPPPSYSSSIIAAIDLIMQQQPETLSNDSDFQNSIVVLMSSILIFVSFTCMVMGVHRYWCSTLPACRCA